VVINRDPVSASAEANLVIVASIGEVLGQIAVAAADKP